MNDRRQHPRRAIPKPVFGKVRSIVPARVVDVSEGGLQLEMSTPLRPGTACEVTVPTASGTVQLRAAVRRCRARSVTTEEGIRLLYYAGLELEGASEEDRAALAEGLDAERSTTLELGGEDEVGWRRGRPG